MSHFPIRPGVLAVALIALAGCDEQGFDLDLRGELGAFDTTDAARAAIADRPRPDDRGVISYPNYQVAVARRKDTVVDLATRVGLPAEELAEYNGLPVEYVLRKGEVLALPRRVAEPSPATGSPTTGPIVAPEDVPEALAAAEAAATPVISPAPAETIDVAALAEDSLARAETSRPAPPPKIATGKEPVRHKVAKGETAYSIARKYNIPVRSLAEWNGLDRDYTVRLGQFLLIPVTDGVPAEAPADETEKPGQGSATPLPPSASEPLPDPADATPAPPKETPPSPEMQQEVTPAATTSDARMIYPVTGKVVRAYTKGRNDGIDISVAAGTPVRAAEGGSVAAITFDTDNVPILILRHADNVLTIYSGVKDIAVNKGDRVKRGQEIARVSSPEILHFEVREGFDAVDPVLYLE